MIRYVIEQVIANFKTWRIMHTELSTATLDVHHNDLNGDWSTFLLERLKASARPQRRGGARGVYGIRAVP